MIKPNELRIGNLLKHTKNGGIFTMDAKLLHALFGGFFGYRCEDYEGIPLTEEWLIKFGFERVPWGFANSDQEMIELFYLKNIIIGISESRALYSPVNIYYCYCFDQSIHDDIDSLTELDCEAIFIHQLQNLFFALTGEELTMNDHA